MLKKCEMTGSLYNFTFYRMSQDCKSIVFYHYAHWCIECQILLDKYNVVEKTICVVKLPS